jgi:hypothetical protein
MRLPLTPIICGIALVAGCAERELALHPKGPVVLTGCLTTAPSPGRYRLTVIDIEAAPAVLSTNALAIDDGLTQWSWVQLTTEAAKLKPYLGSRITVRGSVVNAGRNTIGVPGTWGIETLSGARSLAASDLPYWQKQALEMGRIARQSLANGGAAELDVATVTPTGHACSFAEHGDPPLASSPTR